MKDMQRKCGNNEHTCIRSNYCMLCVQTYGQPHEVNVLLWKVFFEGEFILFGSISACIATNKM